MIYILHNSVLVTRISNSIARLQDHIDNVSYRYAHKVYNESPCQAGLEYFQGTVCDPADNTKTKTSVSFLLSHSCFLLPREMGECWSTRPLIGSEPIQCHY